MSFRPDHFAHSTSRADRADWQPLSEHLQRVADLASRHAAKFGAGEWGAAAGLLHDLGKYSAAFQARLSGRKPVDHSTAGAIEAAHRYGVLARPLQFIIAGHHAGLANGGEEERSRRTSLKDRLSARTEDYGAYLGEIDLPPELPRLPLSPHTGWDGRPHRIGFQCALFTRMLFSCLVDADYLDTESFYDRVEGRPERRAPPPDLADLKARLDVHMTAILARADDTAVNRRRADILSVCRDRAGGRPGLFTLTVPTGGGKTLASLAFALNHALQHGLKRVIYVIPHTSIIEQNAKVFRDALGDDAVLEHHSAFIDDPKRKPEAREKLKLAMENWDAPVVVTTAVQFFESLFADRPSKCRKLHNIARSVVILDEAQTLPLPLLRPSVAALDELARNYGSTVVLCTATQPALLQRDDGSGFKGGFRQDEVREIVPDPTDLYRGFRRVRVREVGEMDNGELAEHLRGHGQALCIVNTRLHAREVYERLRNEEGSFHLSALMCPKHRSERLEKIRAALREGRRCIVVSTTLVEAGVDLDFPVVYRAASGLDQIAQAAGRCNREGRRDSGEVFVFRSAGRRPPGELDRRASAAAGAFRRFPYDPLSLEALQAFFGELYWSEGDDGLDRNRVLDRFEERRDDLLFPFEWIAREFKLIESDMRPVLIPYDDEAKRLLKQLQHIERPGAIARLLQPYVVQLHPQQFARLCAVGALQSAGPGEQFWTLVNDSLYDPEVGLTWDDPTYREPEANVV